MSPCLTHCHLAQPTGVCCADDECDLETGARCAPVAGSADFQDRPPHKGYSGEVLTDEIIKARERFARRNMELFIRGLSGRSGPRFHGGCC